MGPRLDVGANELIFGEDTLTRHSVGLTTLIFLWFIILATFISLGRIGVRIRCDMAGADIGIRLEKRLLNLV